MTRTEAWEKAWRLVAKEKDYSLVDEIYHPDYKAVGSIKGIEVNLAADKEAHLALVEHLKVAPAKTVDEGNDLLYIYRDSKYREEDIFYVRRNLFHLKKIGKIIRRIIGEELDYDSSEGQNCNWEDYE